MDEARPLLAQRNNATQSRVGNPGLGVLDLYLFFNIAPSHFLLPLLCTTLLLARARRNVLLVNVCITWIITGLVSCLLLYTGNQTGPEPPQMLCTTQASLLYAVPPMVSTSILGLVFQVWNNLVWRPGERTRGVFLSIIIILPYVVYFSFAAVGAMIASRDPFRVSRTRRFFYCSIDASMFSTIVALFAALQLLITTILEVWIGITLYRNRQIIKLADPAALNRGEHDKKKISAEDLQFAVRVSIFGGYILVGIALSLLSIVAPTSPVPDMVMASMGTAVFLVFGTQPRVWLVWRDVFKSKEKQQEETHVATLTPYHLDPLPGAPQQPGGVPQMAQVPVPPTPQYRPDKAYGPRTPLAQAPRFALMSGAEYAASSSVPVSQVLPVAPPTPSYLAQITSTTMRSPGYTATLQDTPYRSAREEKAMLAARYQTPVTSPAPAGTPRWPVTADSSRMTMYDHPYRTSTAVAGPPPERRPTVVRGKQPLRPPSRDTLDSYGTEAERGRSQSFDSQHPLVAARPISRFSDDSQTGYATNNSSQDVNSGYATYNSNASSVIPPSAAPLSPADPIEPRARLNAL